MSENSQSPEFQQGPSRVERVKAVLGTLGTNADAAVDAVIIGAGVAADALIASKFGNPGGVVELSTLLLAAPFARPALYQHLNQVNRAEAQRDDTNPPILDERTIAGILAEAWKTGQTQPRRVEQGTL